MLNPSGKPIPGAAVMVQGTNKGTTTNAQGYFSITGLAAGTEVEVEASLIGMKSASQRAIPGQDIIIILEEDALLMDDIIVTGYGDFRRSSYTGSATSVNITKLSNLSTPSVNQLLEGNVPGLAMTPSSGQAGSFVSTRIRGTGSITASFEPLYVIDGVPVSSGNMNRWGTTSDAGFDPLSTINPSDIENITVLKDATSTSLYGSRGSNGVILITTKRGREGKVRVNFKASLGINDYAMLYRPTMDGEERSALIYEGAYNAAISDGQSEQEARDRALQQQRSYASKPDQGYSDWRDAMTRKGFIQNYEISASGGDQKQTFTTSVGYHKTEGNMLTSAFERFSGRMAYNFNNQKLEIGGNAMLSSTKNRQALEGSYYSSGLYPAIYALHPSIPIYDQDGNYNVGTFNTNGGYNPLYEDENQSRTNNIFRILANMNIGYKFTNDLKFSSQFAIDFSNGKQFAYWSPESKDGSSINGGGQQFNTEQFRYTWNNHLSYSKTIGKHNVSALAGWEILYFNYNSLYAYANNYMIDGFPALSNASEYRDISQYENHDRQLSAVARLNYDYDNKYYLAATFREDGSSRLANGHQWGSFWSVSGAWRISAEPFMEATSHWLSDFRLKASYGVNGNLPSGFFEHYGTYSLTNQYGSYGALREVNLPNPELSWEKGYNLNYGIEASFLGRINLSLDLYKRDTKDLLLEKKINPLTGFVSYTGNVGHLRNSGVEISINTINISKNDFSWSSTLNLSHNKSKVVHLSDEINDKSHSLYIRQVGEPWNMIYRLEYAGVDPATGAALYYKNTEDADGNISREITTNPDLCEKILYKDADPDLAGNLNNSFTWKFIDLSFNFTFTLGGWNYDNAMWGLQDDGKDPNKAKSIRLRKRWQKPGDITDVPKYSENYSYGGWYHSTRAVHSSDHLRLKSLIIGFSAPQNWLEKTGIARARIYFSGSNLFTVAAYRDVDPELRMATWQTPPLKTFSFGIELGF